MRDIEGGNDAEATRSFLETIAFDENRHFLAQWIRLRERGRLPPLTEFDDLVHRHRQYAFIWRLNDDRAEFTGIFFGQRLMEFIGLNPRDMGFAEHFGNTTDAKRILAHCLRCALDGSPYSVIRRLHGYAGRGTTGYEVIIMPVALDDGWPGLLGHLLPFEPAGVCDLICPPGAVPDEGRRLRLREPEPSA